MARFNRSEIFKKAWELVKKAGLSLAEALKKAWKEAKMKEAVKETVKKAVAKAQELIDAGDYRIHKGVEREIVVKEWEGRRAYINIYCYSLMRNYKGKYDCGYVDMDTAEYVATKYTEIALL
jgi:hypothetical protein